MTTDCRMEMRKNLRHFSRHLHLTFACLPRCRSINHPLMRKIQQGLVVAAIETARRTVSSALNMSPYRLPFVFKVISKRTEKAPEDHVLRRLGKV